MGSGGGRTGEKSQGDRGVGGRGYRCRKRGEGCPLRLAPRPPNPPPSADETPPPPGEVVNVKTRRWGEERRKEGGGGDGWYVREG